MPLHSFQCMLFGDFYDCVDLPAVPLRTDYERPSRPTPDALAPSEEIEIHTPEVATHLDMEHTVEEELKKEVRRQPALNGKEKEKDKRSKQEVLQEMAEELMWLEESFPVPKKSPMHVHEGWLWISSTNVLDYWDAMQKKYCSQIQLRTDECVNLSASFFPIQIF